MNDELIEENEVSDYKIPDLYDRLLKDNRFIKYHDVISNIKKKSGKRAKCSGDSDDEKILGKHFKKPSKTKILYPKD